VVRVGLSELEKPKPDLLGPHLAETPAEGLLVRIGGAGELDRLAAAVSSWANARRPDFVVVDLPAFTAPDPLARHLSALRREIPGIVLLRSFAAGEGARLRSFATFARANGCLLACDITPADLGALGATLRELGGDGLVATYSGGAEPGPGANGNGHPLGAYRRLAAELARLGLRLPIWIRNAAGTGMAASGGGSFLSRLLDASFLTGGLLCDGVGDIVSIETEADPVRSVRLAYNVLQGAGSRISKTEFVACPSCGRTLFDLQTTT
jgi:(E)-4-hydroxy-3-methylbut-2-enyl-diphosphate synthase